MITTLNGAQKAVDDLHRLATPPAKLEVIDAPELGPGWVWVMWGNVKVKGIQRHLWESL